MFWKLTSLSATSPVDSVLDKDNFTLEELLDEEEVIQECKAMNSRLINFLRDRAQVEQLIQYIVVEPPEDAENKRAFKFPFIACEVFTCEIDVILKTLVEEEELMNLLFAFLEPNRRHSPLLAGYFGKVVICLMIRKTIPLMNYVQAHQDIFQKLVDLIGITSIMEVLVRLVGADDHTYPNYVDVMQWLAASNLLEMIVDKLSPSSLCEVHANAAETLCAISRNAPSPLATKLSSPCFVARIFGHALEHSQSKSALVHSLSVCISLLDPKRSASPFICPLRNQHIYDSRIPINPDTVGAMLPKLGELLMLLNLSSDEKVLPTTYGELKPPLGKHRLKIVEFIAVLLRTGNEIAEKELVCSGTIRRVLDLFFEYPYNNSLHLHVESIVLSCLESKSNAIVDHLLQECNLLGKILQRDKQPNLSGDCNQPSLPATRRQPPRVGNLGHITRISNKLVQLANSNSCIQAHLQANGEWVEWQATTLQERNTIENVYRWACGRPTAFQDRTRDSDDDDIHDRDYDVKALSDNISQAFRYNMYSNEDTEEDRGTLDRDVEDVYFNDGSAEVVISSLRLGDEQGSSLFTNSNWFAFQDNRDDDADAPMSSSHQEPMDEISLNGTTGGSSGSDDEVVVGEDEELAETKVASSGMSCSNSKASDECFRNGFVSSVELNQQSENASASGDITFFQFESPDSEDLFGDRPLPDWVAWGDSEDLQIGGSSMNPFVDNDNSSVSLSSSTESGAGPAPSDCLPSNGGPTLPNGSLPTTNSSGGSVEAGVGLRSDTVPSLFEEDVEFVGVELEGTEKAMEQALREGIVGEAGPLKMSLIKKNISEKENSDEGGAGMKEFNDANYWRVDQEVAVIE